MRKNRISFCNYAGREIDCFPSIFIIRCVIDFGGQKRYENGYYGRVCFALVPISFFDMLTFSFWLMVSG